MLSGGKTYHVVTQTRCTRPDANIEKHRHNRTGRDKNGLYQPKVQPGSLENHYSISEYLQTESVQSFLIKSGASVLTFWEDLGLEPLPKKQVFQIIKCLIIQLR